METFSRTIRHDEVLGLEAFCLQGYAQPFPRHFHDYYVLGFVVSGERELLCNGLNLQVFPGNLLIFNPRDNHECVSTSRAPFLHYLGFNILKKRMEEISMELTVVFRNSNQRFFLTNPPAMLSWNCTGSSCSVPMNSGKKSCSMSSSQGYSESMPTPPCNRGLSDPLKLRRLANTLSHTLQRQ